MRPYTVRKLAELAASLLILVPSVLLLAWEPAIPNSLFFWVVLLSCCGVFLAALLRSERERGAASWRELFGRCGGFCIMFFFLLYQTASALLRAA